MIMDPIGNFLGMWAVELNTYSIIFRIFIAILLGTIIGCERSSKRHAAGLRTFMLVFIATAVSMILDSLISKGSGMHLISAAALLGISTISVNSILYSSRNQIRGLTTAVGIWLCGIIGLCIGAGYYTITLVSFFALMVSISFFPELEIYLKNRSNHFEIHIEFTNQKYLQDFVTVIRKLGLRIDDIELNPAYANSGLSVYTISVSIISEELKQYKTHKEIIEALSTLEYVSHVEEIR
ncbi:MAG: MgtC/SapB family protein [Clostridia bacterium]|nr:MgtC/SapB family protein [Clostridia bacterium]